MEIKEIAKIIQDALNSPREKRLFINDKEMKIRNFFEIPIIIGAHLERNEKILLQIGNRKIRIN